MIIIAVIVSLLFPHIKDYCTLYMLLHLATASLGLIWIYFDLSTFIESAMCSGLNLLLDKMVLDDILRAIYDPIGGLWACFVGAYLGASSMYGLHMNEAQRTELIQSSLGLRDKSQACSVLLKPGGCKALLPIYIQNWLMSSQTDRHEGNLARVVANHSNITDSSCSWSAPHSTDGEGLGSDKSAPDNDTVEIHSHDAQISEEYSQSSEERSYPCPDKFDSFEHKRIVRLSAPKALETEGIDQADPLVIFFRIVQQMAQNKLKRYAEALPRSKIENIGIAAAVAFGIQLTLRRSSKKSSLIEYCCAAIATISFGTVLSREAFLGSIHDKQTVQIFYTDFALSILNKIKEKSASNNAFFSMLVLVIFCRRRKVRKIIPVADKIFKR